MRTILVALPFLLMVSATTQPSTVSSEQPPITPVQKKQLDVKITIEGRKEHPIVYMTRDDIQRARANRDKYPWAKKAADNLLAEADKWAVKSDEDLIKFVPPPKATYAYGFAPCPICGGTFAAWWGGRGVCTMDDPGHVRCVNGHRLPDDAHPDAGDGYVNTNGAKNYFVGTYNAYIADILTSATSRLVHAYALTGDQKYAHKAAVLLDHLARIYPTNEVGAVDYPSNPTTGRFNRPWYQVGRTLVSYANQYDILLMGDELNQPSSVPGMTRKQNIEQNMLLNGAAYCYRESVKAASLTNGGADYIRGPMAVAAAMGIPEYISWGVDGPYSLRTMIANNVDRDGEYYETSAGYSDYARILYMDMAGILCNYKDAAHPDGIKLADDPVFVMFNMLASTRLRCAGHQPSLGDDGTNVQRISSTQNFHRFDISNLERLLALAEDPKLIAELNQLLLLNGDLEKTRASFMYPEWLLFHARDVDASSASGAAGGFASTLDRSDLFAQKGLAILRAGKDENARAVTLRYGPTLNHGHLDEMNINIYARGYEMTYDLGYGLASTHAQVGWSHNTASHNTVVVDETPQLKTGRAGGSLKYFATVPGVSVVRADDPICYQSQNVSTYERTVATIDADSDLSYIVDIFHVVGGKQHDYMFHCQGTDLTTDGIKLGEPAEGSVAGKDIGWGDKIGADGNVIGVVDKDYWNAPPGNGYGFLMHPQRGAISPSAGTADRAGTSSLVSATWAIDRDQKHPANLRLNILATQGEQLIVANAPGIYPKFPNAKYVIRRTTGDNLDSTFVSVIEPYGSKRAIKGIKREAIQLASAIGLRIELADGRVDTITWTPQGRFQVTRDGKDLLNVPGDDITGTLKRIDHQNLILYTDAKLPDGVALAGHFVHVTNPTYAQESPYRIASVTHDGDLAAIHLTPTRIVLGRGHLDTDPPDAKTLPNVLPMEYAKSVVHKSSGNFHGKRVTTPAGQPSGKILDFDDHAMVITVDSSQGFKAGDDLIVYDICEGDTIRLPVYRSRTAIPTGTSETHSGGGAKDSKP